MFQIFCKILLFLWTLGVFTISLWESSCPLDKVPSPPIESYTKNIETLLEAAKNLATSSECVKPEWYPSYLDVAIPAQSIQTLLNSFQSLGYNIGSLASDMRYYFDTTGMLLPSVQQHQSTILEIETTILSAGRFIGSRCGQAVRFEEDIEITWSLYKTKNRTLQDILTDSYAQTSHVLLFFRNLVTNVADREYLDETQFTLAPSWFATEMRKFYTSEALQKCHDADPKNESIREVMKKSFSFWWKYPQAIQIWKDAFALLLYRWGQIAGNTETDPAKDAQINTLVEAQKWGVGNSRFLLNSQFFKEFWKRANNQPVAETVKDTGKRIAYEVFWYIFLRQTLPDIKRANPEGYARPYEFSSFDTDARALAEIDRWLYNDYARRKVLVGQDKEQNPDTSVGLVQSIHELEKARPIIEENTNLACDSLNKQATNIQHPGCPEFAQT